MSEKTVFAVLACTAYEGNDVVCVFESESDALAFAKRCYEHEQAKRKCPALDAPDEEWDAYQDADRVWSETHPAAPYTGRDSYVAVAIQLIAAAPTEQK